ncbi:hypothetical protein EJ04DRAFT_525079 [Polyplosphaeria fusca]|uniref:Uncharacterized protein n=1 Tax=Polyplosphaeria fusca TaxID=682080 RepID=A0A9P4QWD1_9PLEO|nr:hypothetical protein EJ04DRAFT_525079 [Polyplosphaeria fusca]
MDKSSTTENTTAKGPTTSSDASHHTTNPSPLPPSTAAKPSSPQAPLTLRERRKKAIKDLYQRAEDAPGKVYPWEWDALVADYDEEDMLWVYQEYPRNLWPRERDVPYPNLVAWARHVDNRMKQTHS